MKKAILLSLCLVFAATLLTASPSAGFGLGKIISGAKDAVKIGKAAKKATAEITPEQEYYLGRTIGAHLLAQYKPWNNNALNKYLNVMGRTLARASDKPQTFGGYRFLALNSNEVNAFACPGGLVLVSKGLIRLCKNEDELASVVAHEIGHVAGEHGLKSIKSSRQTELATTIAGTAVKQASGRAGQLMNLFGGSVDDIVKTLVVNGYSRSQEMEADRSAVIIMSRVGYQPHGIVNVLERMGHKFKSDKLGFAKTHPDPADRIKALKKFLKEKKKFSPVKARQARYKKGVGTK